MKDTSESFSKLSNDEQRALLAELLRKKTAKPKKAPLSFSQERMWFLYQMNPENVVHNMWNITLLHGQLDVQKLQQSFNLLVARHETLRTTFEMVDDVSYQLIAAKLDVTIPVIHLSGTTQAEQEAEMAQIARNDVQSPFNLTTGPLMRITLMTLNEKAHFLLITMHHIVSDEWSMGILFSEMMMFYKMLVLGNDVREVPALPLQYADFAAWQREWLQNQELQIQSDYWKKHLANMPILELPTDYERPALLSNRGTIYSWMFDEALSGQLKLLAQKEGVSLFMFFLASISVLLYRYSGQADLTVRSPIANRMRKELEKMIGYFANTFALRVDLSGASTFRELLHQVEGVCKGGYAHQDVPFEKVLENIKFASRKQGKHGPAFPVMFILQNSPLEQLLDIPGIKLEHVELDDQLAPFELTIAIRETKDGLRGRVNYNTDLFKTTSMEKMAKHLQAVIEQAVANPDESILRLLDVIADDEIPAVRLSEQQTLKQYDAPPQTPTEVALAEILCDVLGLEKIGIYDDFSSLGGDSLLMLQVVTRAKNAGLHFTPMQMMQNQSIAKLAALQESHPLQAAEQGIISGELHLTVAQSSFLNRGFQNPSHWNVANIVEVHRHLQPELVSKALECVINHHDGLRLRFQKNGEKYSSRIVEVEDAKVFLHYDFSHLPQSAHKQAIESTGNDLHHRLNISNGPLLQVALIDLGELLPQRLIIVLHHLLFDNVSLLIIFDDFFRAYTLLSENQPVTFPLKTTSLKQWTERLYSYAHSAALRAELDYWLSLPWKKIHPLPLDYPENQGKNTANSAKRIATMLSVDETNTLLYEAAKHQIEIRDILLAALLQVLTNWSGGEWTLINEITSGRYAIPNTQDLDISRTVGWLSFTNYLILKKNIFENPIDFVLNVREQLRQMPNGGQGYEMLLHCSESAEVVEKLKPYAKYNLLFNYTGQAEKRRSEIGGFLETLEKDFLKPAQEDGGMLHNPHQDPDNLRDSILICPVAISQNQLVARWIYSENLHRHETIEHVAQNFKHELQKIIGQMRAKQS